MAEALTNLAWLELIAGFFLGIGIFSLWLMVDTVRDFGRSTRYISEAEKKELQLVSLRHQINEIESRPPM